MPICLYMCVYPHTLAYVYGSLYMSSNISLQIDIVGHSGDSPDIKFVSSAAPPSNDKERLNVLEVHTYIHVSVHMYWGYIQYMCTCVSSYYNTVYANYFSTRIIVTVCTPFFRT